MAYYGASGDIRDNLSGGQDSSQTYYVQDAEVDGGMIERGRRWAKTLIDSKLRASYPNNVPWTSGSEPEEIYEISNGLAECWIRKKIFPGPEPMKKDTIQECVDFYMDWLNRIANYEDELVDVTSPLGYDEVHHTLSGYKPFADVDDILTNESDSDLIDDILDER